MEYQRLKQKYPNAVTRVLNWHVKNLPVFKNVDSFMEEFFKGELSISIAESYYADLYITNPHYVDVLKTSFPKFYEESKNRIHLDMVNERDYAFAMLELFLTKGYHNE